MLFKEGSTVCLPIEYVDGNSLADRSQRILQAETALEYISQIEDPWLPTLKFGTVNS